jgi:transposase
MPCSPASASCLYPCDLTDAEWASLAPLPPEPSRRGRQRRLSKDYERKVQTSETLLQFAMIRLMLRRLAKSIG